MVREFGFNLRFPPQAECRSGRAYSNAVQNRAVSKPPNVNSIRVLVPMNDQKWEAAAARSIRAIRMGLMRARAIEQRENHE